VDEDIARRQREAEAYTNPEPIYVATAPAAGAAEEHGANGAFHSPAPSLYAELHGREVKIAVLETELRMERDARVRAEQRADQLETRSRARAQQRGKYKERIAMREAPKNERPAPEPDARPPADAGDDDARPRASFWRRLFGER